MNYTTAVNNVLAGQYSWRTSWSARYLLLHSGSVYVNDNGNIGPYTPTQDDQAASNWDSGDHPPKL